MLVYKTLELLYGTFEHLKGHASSPSLEISLNFFKEHLFSLLGKCIYTLKLPSITSRASTFVTKEMSTLLGEHPLSLLRRHHYCLHTNFDTRNISIGIVFKDKISI
jgi:hypothetical protein